MRVTKNNLRNSNHMYLAGLCKSYSSATLHRMHMCVLRPLAIYQQGRLNVFGDYCTTPNLTMGTNKVLASYRHNPRKCMAFASLTEENLTMISVPVQHQQHGTLPSPTLYMGNDNCDTPTYRTGSTLKISTGIGRAVAHASITLAVPSTTHHGL